jgi:hypothetical protein
VATGEETVRWLQKWPGRSNAVENKVCCCETCKCANEPCAFIQITYTDAVMEVPTVLVYPKNSTTPSSWGFSSETPTEQMSEDKECKEWFKTFLDEERLQQAQRDPKNKGVCPASIQEVEQL